MMMLQWEGGMENEDVAFGVENKRRMAGEEIWDGVGRGKNTEHAPLGNKKRGRGGRWDGMCSI